MSASERGRRRPGLVELPDWPGVMETRTAAAYLDMSTSKFDVDVRPEVPVVRRGSYRGYRRAELDKWAAKNAKATLREAA